MPQTYQRTNVDGRRALAASPHGGGLHKIVEHKGVVAVHTKIQPGTIEALLDPQVFAYHTGVSLRGYSAQRKNGEWQVIFRGRTKKDKFVYCLYVAVELEDAIEGLYGALLRRGGSRLWYPDKYAK